MNADLAEEVREERDAIVRYMRRGAAVLREIKDGESEVQARIIDHYAGGIDSGLHHLPQEGGAHE